MSTALTSTAKGLKEAAVTRQIKDFLLYRKWRPIRFQRTVIPGMFSTGEPGIPDYLFVRYLENPRYAGLSVACWVEVKRQRGGKLGEHQIKWRDKETIQGAIVLTARDLDEFTTEYYAKFGWIHQAHWVDGQAEIEF